MKTELMNEWQKEWTETEDHPYARAIVRIADKIMQYIDMNGGAKIDTNDLVHRADRELSEGITGNMAAYAVMLAAKYHDRGQEVMQSWNAYWGRPGDTKGVINPAVVELREDEAHREKS